jgi:uncharacterized protein (TIGR00661 family)
LDWGLGHASRCVPLIKQFIKEGHQVIIGADNNPLTFLKKEFPSLKTIVIPGIEIKYGKSGSFLKMMVEGTKFNHFIKEEKKRLDKLLLEDKVDLIVSDNRYGLYSDKVESIIITHQLYPKVPIGESLIHKRITQLLNNFDEVWIPDNEGVNSLSGELSQLKSLKQNHKFIGPLSRFDEPGHPVKIEFDVCAIISGPEPQRTMFEELILEQIKSYNLKAVVCRGLPGKEEKGDQLVFNHLNTANLQEYILKSNYVVCRSGYSSIMDLHTLKKQAILVPTPGQSEQEYLAEHHNLGEQFIVQQQKKLDLGVVLKN